MDDKIIPFGKYKGKPVEILATDSEYVDWLTSQSFFKEKYINLYNVIINNFREPVDTPEHNKIQIKFLEIEYRIKLAFLLNPNLFENNSEKINIEMNKLLEKIDIEWSGYFIKSLKKPDKNERFGLYTTQLLNYSNPVFERVDVSFNISYGIKFNYGSNYGRWECFEQKKISSFWLEIKPTVSDDFPSVLRQMKASMPYKRSDYNTDKYFILLVGAYTGKSVSKSEFIAYFKTQGYIVIFENQINEVKLPRFDNELILDEKIKELIKRDI